MSERNLDNPDDWVRVEIASALDRNVKVIPVIIDDAVLPKSSDLPSDLKSLPEFQAFRVQNSQFERDSAALADKLREALGQTNAPTANEERLIKSIEQKFRSLITERPRFWKAVGIIGVIFLMMLGVLAYVSGDRMLSQWSQSPSVLEKDAIKQKPSVLEEDVKSEILPIEPKPSVLEKDVKPKTLPFDSKPSPFRTPPPRPPPAQRPFIPW